MRAEEQGCGNSLDRVYLQWYILSLWMVGSPPRPWALRLPVPSPVLITLPSCVQSHCGGRGAAVDPDFTLLDVSVAGSVTTLPVVS